MEHEKYQILRVKIVTQLMTGILANGALSMFYDEKIAMDLSLRTAELILNRCGVIIDDSRDEHDFI